MKTRQVITEGVKDAFLRLFLFLCLAVGSLFEPLIFIAGLSNSSVSTMTVLCNSAKRKRETKINQLEKKQGMKYPNK